MAARLTLSALVLVIATVSLSQALRGPGPKKCCFNFKTKPVPVIRVMGFTWTHQQCTKAAVLLKMKSGKELCVIPSMSWVQKIIHSLDPKTPVGAVNSA